MKNIVLYGMRGVGKTTIGRMLAERKQIPYYDLDVLIKEDVGIPIFEFIEKYGWDEFRKKEHENLVKILRKKEDKILSLGGGAITFENNQDILRKESSKLIYLEAPLATIAQRIQADEEKGEKRNSLTGKGLLEELSEIYEKRKGIYESFYDFKVQNSTHEEQTLQEILEKIQYGGVCIPIIDFSLQNLEKQIEEVNSSREITWVELRIDFIQDDNYQEIYKLIKTIKKKVLITNRRKEEGGRYEGSYAMCINKLQQFAPYAEYIDIELMAGDAIYELKKHIGDKKLILSYHDFASIPDIEFLKEKLKLMSAYSPDVYKIACMPQSADDIHRLYALQEYFTKEYIDKDFIFIAMGELGKETRINMPQKGALLSFGSLQDSSAPGQIPYKELYRMIHLQDYIIDTKENIEKSLARLSSNQSQFPELREFITTDFEERIVLLLGGDQISASLSPFIHTYSSLITNNPLLYVLFTMTKEERNLDAILQEITDDSRILGANVTMPYKVDAYTILDGKGNLDDSAKIAGAVNTLAKENGKIIGYNTDFYGILHPLKEKLLQNKEDIKRGYVLGAGGAAMAVVAALLKFGIPDITVFNRVDDGFKHLIHHFNSGKVRDILKAQGIENYSVQAVEYEVQDDQKSEIASYIDEKGILVNTLPFGFKSSLPIYPIRDSECDGVFKNIVLFYDIVYDLAYENTPMMEYVKEKYPNIQSCDGIDMLVEQAKKGFELWTKGNTIDEVSIKKIIRRK